MKRLYATCLLLVAVCCTVCAQTTPISQMEKLNRGLLAISTSNGTYLSWRFLGTDNEDATTFDILRNGVVVASDAYQTNYQDNTKGNNYQVVVKVNGQEVERTPAVTPWNSNCLTIPMQRPAGGILSFRPYDSSTKKYGSFTDTPYTYSPNDCSVGDVDGDGEYEIIVKWDPSNSQDNSIQSGKTGNVYLDCYKLNGTLLWRIDLGKNIRAGAHYTQFMVYDFDGDGKAELMCKTAQGSMDGTGQYVNQAATDASIKAASNTAEFRNANGAITGGQEYLTVFNGETGEAIHTIFYNPNRNQGYGGAADGSFNWGTPNGKNDKADYGNRGERYLAAVAYLDGPDAQPSGIFSRGYYGYAFIWAVDFDGTQLKQRWLSSHKDNTKYSVTTFAANGQGTTRSYTPGASSSGEGRNTMFANGNHNLSIADVDGDGKDEIIWGSAALDDNGQLLYAVGYGHGDAMHLSDLDPTRPGLELFDVHEDKGTYAWDVHDAATGEILHKGGPAGKDNGRGIAAQIDTNHYGAFFSSSVDKNQRSAVSGEIISEKSTSLNFRIYWDGDLQDELLDGNKVDKWNGKGTTRLVTLSGNTCNSTKNTPNLSADILGDWREELILWDNATCNLLLYTTTKTSSYRMPTLMHDHTYRMGICWQNVAYNQPPHLGYYLPDAMKPAVIGSRELTVGTDKPVNWVISGRRTKVMNIDRNSLAAGLSLTTTDGTTQTISGAISQEGDYTIPVTLTGLGNELVEEKLTIHVVNSTGIDNVKASRQATSKAYDIMGRAAGKGTRGVIIIRENGKTKKIVK